MGFSGLVFLVVLVFLGIKGFWSRREKEKNGWSVFREKVSGFWFCSVRERNGKAVWIKIVCVLYQDKTHRFRFGLKWSGLLRSARITIWWPGPKRKTRMIFGWLCLCVDSWYYRLYWPIIIFIPLFLPCFDILILQFQIVCLFNLINKMCELF